MVLFEADFSREQPTDGLDKSMTNEFVRNSVEKDDIRSASHRAGNVAGKNTAMDNSDDDLIEPYFNRRRSGDDNLQPEGSVGSRALKGWDFNSGPPALSAPCKYQPGMQRQ